MVRISIHAARPFRDTNQTAGYDRCSESIKATCHQQVLIRLGLNHAWREIIEKSRYEHTAWTLELVAVRLVRGVRNGGHCFERADYGIGKCVVDVFSDSRLQMVETSADCRIFHNFCSTSFTEINCSDLLAPSDV